ncbi:MAG: hypothetical protein RBU45_03125 [Myxococcota bacterium]|nr:hypothetical protein [Myxococcota bacterium]
MPRSPWRGVLVPLVLVAAGCSTVPGLLDEGRYAEAARRLAPAHDPLAGAELDYPDATAQVVLAVHRTGDASVRLQALTVEQVADLVGLSPRGYGDSWVLVALLVDTTGAAASLRQVMVGVDTAGGSYRDLCRGGPCNDHLVLRELDALLGATRSWSAEPRRDLAELLGALGAFGAGIVDLPFQFGTLGRFDPGTRTLLPRLLAAVPRDGPRPSTGRSPLADDPAGRREASARLFGLLISEGGAALARGENLNFFVLRNEGPRSGAVERLLLLEQHEWLDDEGLAVARARYLLPLPGSGPLPARIGAAFGAEPRLLRSLSPGASR